MRFVFAAALVGSLVGSVLPALAAEESAGPAITLIQAGRLLADPATGRVETDKTIVVADGKIVAIEDGFPNRKGDVIDLRNAFVLPGFIDSHVHLTFEQSAHSEIDQVRLSSADRAVLGALYARRNLEAGFTTVADLGGDPDAALALRDGTATGKIPGPRIIAAGGVAAIGGHFDIHGFRQDVEDVLHPRSLCAGADDCRRAVREQVSRGFDEIKIASTGGVLSNTAAGLAQQMTSDEIKAIVETAHQLGRHVVCHAHGTDGINAALAAGVDSIEHGTYLDARSVELFKKNGAYYVPTMMAADFVGREARRPGTFFTPAQQEKALKVGEKLVEAVKRAHAAGVKFAFGTDTGVSAHGNNAREFALMVAAGFTPLDAIRAATVWGAAHNKLSGEIGSIAQGKSADIVAVLGDPLKDVSELEHVAFVMARGSVFKNCGGGCPAVDTGDLSVRSNAGVGDE
ncbi:MAG: amidohydrolase family protein [Alphaproteobacteria bacterium]